MEGILHLFYLSLILFLLSKANKQLNEYFNI